MKVEPYVFFPGNCEEALKFYEKALGAKISFVMRFKDAPPGQAASVPSQWQDKIMHANLTVGSTQVMASDGFCDEKNQTKGFNGFSLTIAVKDVKEGERLFTALSQGGEITMPFQKTFWSPGFGQLEDRFGLGWMVTTEP